jgi:(p)ppGpp synthase/HD superfamily hydrolase
MPGRDGLAHLDELPTLRGAEMKNVAPVLTSRFTEALNIACALHEHDARKGTTIPYVAYLLGVCSLVLTDGGDEDEAIAALLHDALEDHPDRISGSEIETRFGGRVRAIVEACTDTPHNYTGGEKPEWRARKTTYVNHIRDASPDDLRVSVADKLYNARAILADVRRLGDQVWLRFNAGKHDQLWYYGSLVRAFRDVGVRGQMVEDLERTVAELERL